MLNNLPHSFVRFATSITVRENNPDEGSDEPLLSRRDSFTSIRSVRSTAGSTEPDHLRTPFVLPAAQAGQDISKSISQEKLDDGGSVTVAASITVDHQSEDVEFGKDERSSHVAPDGLSMRDSGWTIESERDGDYTPFDKKFSPSNLAMLVDPKNLKLLQEMGGVRGLIVGLGTDMKKGLGAGRSADLGGEGSSSRAGYRSSRRHNRRANHAGKTSDPMSPLSSSHTSGRFGRINADDSRINCESVNAVSMDDRQRVDGHNLFPVRKSVNLSLLTWSTLRNKVLPALPVQSGEDSTSSHAATTANNESLHNNKSSISTTQHSNITLPVKPNIGTICDLTGAVSLKEAPHVVHARGGFGEIRWGNLATGQDVALKLLCIRAKAPRILRETKRFHRETGIWSRLEHPNILPFLGVADFPGLSTCLVSPLMRNGNCRDFLDRHPHTLILPIIQGITYGLSYLHNQVPSVVHGDLSCSNVLISDSGQPLLSDFGLAVIVEELSELPMSSALQDAGNVRWMAPELLVGNTTVNKASDIWALGMVFLEVMTREIPFAEYRHPLQVIMALHHGERPSKPTVENSSLGALDIIWNLCEGCWSQQPSDRPDAPFVLQCVDAASNHEP